VAEHRLPQQGHQPNVIWVLSLIDLFTLMRHSVTGPAWATGGPFGPEAGAVIVPSYALGILLIMAYTRRRQRPPALSKTPSPIPQPETAS